MSDAFLAYLRTEGERIDQALARARSDVRPDDAEIVRLRKQRLIVDNQLARWAADLSRERVPA